MLARFLDRLPPWIRAIDPAVWILILGIIVRADVALRFDPRGGYDAPTHMAYTDTLKKGVIPRVGMDIPGGVYATQNPPVFYTLALAFDYLGLGQWSGVLVAFLAGIARLFLADHIFKRELSKRGRIYANAFHAFIPFAIRIDVYYSPEGLAGALVLAAVVLALERWTLFAGVAFGLALLTKASAVAAGPAVAYALFTSQESAYRIRWSNKSLAALVLAGAMLLPWAKGNLEKYHTPYPSAYIPEFAKYPQLWGKSLFAKHELEFYLPRFRYHDLIWPYSDNRPSLPDAFFMEAWGDYYNFLGNPTKNWARANNHPLDLYMCQVHRIGCHLGVLVLIGTIAGAFGAARRAVQRKMSRGEAALALLGVGYLALSTWYSIWVVYEYHGAVKATYALASAPILAFWTARAFDTLAARGRRWPLIPGFLAGLTIALAIFARIIW